MKFLQRFNPCAPSSSLSSTTQDNKSTKVEVVPAGPAPIVKGEISHRVAFGAGCFWGVESYIVRNFQTKFPFSINVKNTKVGFMSPLSNATIRNPTYEQVCKGTTGHVEVLYVELNDPARHFEELCRFFFTFHDPTLKDRQGNDVGFQYSSWIFTDGPEQYRIAQKVKQELQAALDARVMSPYGDRTVETRIANLSDFTEASPEHQEYLAKNPGGYCNHRIRLKQWYEIRNQ
jgi:peptide-methionine (S)-S-oxide reductase